jgi:CheY-like chemotaxis protein
MNSLTLLENERSPQSNTILVVEDDPLILTLEVEVLKRAGYQVLSAGDGVDGAVFFARNFQEIDVLVTDVSLPGMRGPHLAQFARKIRPDIKVLFASGGTQSEGRTLQETFARSRHLPKPFTAEQLVAAVGDLLVENACVDRPLSF